jgi:hypothetical protein
MADTYWKKALELGYDKVALEEHIAEVMAGATKLKSKKR